MLKPFDSPLVVELLMAIAKAVMGSGVHSKLTDVANLLVIPSADAENISVILLKMPGSGVIVGPVLMGLSKSAHVVAQAITVRNLVNTSVVAVEHAMRQVLVISCK